jgi:hypothetical protein
MFVDAYVVSCGAPDPAVDHAERMCNFAIDMVRAASTVISPLDGEALQIRCGLHSGAVMSGVVGDVRPRYCKLDYRHDVNVRVLTSTWQVSLVTPSTWPVAWNQPGCQLPFKSVTVSCEPFPMLPSLTSSQEAVSP